MHKFIIAGLFVLIFTGTHFSLNAQYTDTTRAIKPRKDSLGKPLINRNAASAERIFPYKSYLLPATFIIYGFLSLHTDAFQDVNETIKEEVYTERSPHKISLDNYLQYAPAVAVYGLNVAGIHGKNNFRDRTIIYGISSLIMGLTVNSVKSLTKETRPDGSDNLSYPSGHTSTAFASAEFLWQEYKDVSPFYGIAGYAAATATAYLRISNNKHWMGDVVAGAGIGIISTKLTYWIYPAIKRKLFKNKDVRTIVMPTYQDKALGLGLVHHFK